MERKLFNNSFFSIKNSSNEPRFTVLFKTVNYPIKEKHGLSVIKKVLGGFKKCHTNENGKM